MKVALITPYYREQTRGNAVTVSRIEQHLVNEGCNVKLFSLDAMSPEEILAGIKLFAPDLVHVFHALHCGKVALHSSEQLGIPCMVTLTGTDIYPESGTDNSLMADVLAGAELITVFHDAVREKLAAWSPLLREKCRVVPQGVTLPETAALVERRGPEFKFLLPAGIRAVKNPMFALAPLGVLYRKYPDLRLQLAGPILDPVCGAALLAAIRHHPFAQWLGEIPRSSMAELYSGSDVVLNTSLSEGGMANSLLEAMACGVSVLAADIEGNRSLVNDGVNGLLYRGETDFITKATELMLNSPLRKRLGEAGREYVRANCSPVLEARRYLELYAEYLD
jgi:glycosyltransferase involved in cell wall biosynthesis